MSQLASDRSDSIDLTQLDHIPLPLFVLEPDNRGDLVYIAFNTTALEVAKFIPSDYLGRTAMDLYPGEFGQYAYEQHLKTYQSGKLHTYELSLPLDGRVRHIKTRLNPVLDSQGRVIRLIGASTEVTAEHDLQAVRDQARSIDTELQEFVYLAAHDLRSPMSSVQQMADLIRDDFVDLGDGKLQEIGMLETVATRALSLIDSVLQHAEVTSDNELIETFILADLCHPLLQLYDPSAQHTLVVNDCTIRADRKATEVIVRNLIDNAIKHNGSTPLRLEISATTLDSEFFSVSVCDDGKGIPNPGTLFQATESNRSKSGFGLLAIRRLIKARGGTISAEAAGDGTGLVVTFTLPGTLSTL
jgi:signal transduction histidine kinase